MSARILRFFLFITLGLLLLAGCVVPSSSLAVLVTYPTTGAQLPLYQEVTVNSMINAPDGWSRLNFGLTPTWSAWTSSTLPPPTPT